MNKSVLISIRPNWCEKIASGYKTLEIRKTRPKLQPPFKCYIYQTMTGYVSKSKENDILVPIAYGKVIGEFVCQSIDKIRRIGTTKNDTRICTVDEEFYCHEIDNEYLNKCGMSIGELKEYDSRGTLYGWNISNLKIYDVPEDLSDFGLSSPPQSWRYINR